MQKVCSILEFKRELSFYLCLWHCIMFDGFLNCEGRWFGVPYWYRKKDIVSKGKNLRLLYMIMTAARYLTYALFYSSEDYGSKLSDGIWQNQQILT